MSQSKTASWKIALAAIFCAFAVTAVVSHFWVSYRVDQDVARLNVIVSALAASDSGYGDLKVVRSTHPHAFIFGTLDSQARIDAVHAKVARSFGPDETRRIVSQIRLLPPATRPNGA
jgi:hypothetical protein